MHIFCWCQTLPPAQGRMQTRESCCRFEVFPAEGTCEKKPNKKPQTCRVCEEALWLCKELFQPSPFWVSLIYFIKTIVSLQELSEWTHIFSYPVAAFLQLGVFFFLFFVFANKVFKPHFEWQPVLDGDVFQLL